MMPRDIVVGTAGHIDHGKTALVRALTGVDTDRLPAEKDRGITIDLGFAALTLGVGRRAAIVDVPGHERFVRNMLAGASGVDLALLAVAADDSVMPQTREHLDILRLLGIPAGLVALTKCDLVEPGWLDLVEEDIRGLVAGTFLEGAPVVRTSAATGAGIDALREALVDLAGRLPEGRDAGLFRMAVDRGFTVAGHGTVVTGTVASGTVRVGDELTLWPEGKPVRVRGLHQHERAVPELGRGARAAINLAGVRHEETWRGQELAAAGWLEASRVLGVELTVPAEAARPLRHRGRYRLHLGTGEIAATLAVIEGNSVEPGGRSLGQLLLERPVVAVYGQPFVLRQESPPATLGGGRVLQPTGRRLRRRDLAGIDRLRRLGGDDPTDRVRAALAARGLAGGTDAALVREAGVAVGEVVGLLAGLEAAGEVVELAVGPRRSLRVLAETAADLEGRVLRALGRLHAARPRQTAIRRGDVAAELPDLGSDTLIGALLERLARGGKVVATGRTVALVGNQPKLSHSERKLKADLGERLRAGGLSPPDFAELSALAGAKAPILRELLALLVDEGQAVAVAPDLHLDVDAEATMREKVRMRLADGGTLTMAELRDLLGTTRKYAVPFGEYLDRVGVTRREGDVRRRGEAPAGAAASGGPA
jgi:selenocysteine-specific elongation factor